MPSGQRPAPRRYHNIRSADEYIAALEDELAEARRRRDEWRRKAEGYDAVRAALHAKIGDPGPARLSKLIWVGLAASEKKRADDAEARIAELEAVIARLTANDMPEP